MTRPATMADPLRLLGPLLVASALLGHRAASAEDFAFEREGVLGTSMEVHVRAESLQQAERVEARVVAEVERLAAILNNHDPESEFRRWQAPGGPRQVSPELLEVMRQAEHWQQLSGGAFHPAVQSLSLLWADCARESRMPTDEEIEEARAAVARPLWRLDPVAGTAGKLSDAPLTLDAIAKGAIIDRAVAAGMGGEGDGVAGLMVNIGGDLLARGEPSPTVGIADPRDDSETSRPLCRIVARDLAVATSGGHRRGFVIAGRRYSHLIDPRTGRPASAVLSATAVAPRAADADALATILALSPAVEGIRLADSLPGVECLIVTAGGDVARSRGWADLEVPGSSIADAPPADPAGFELLVTFELRRPPAGRSFRRPYVAIWVEDESGSPVRTLALWARAGGSGDRWLPELRRWYRGDRLRTPAHPTGLAATISRATRPSGEYQVIWDRTDDRGRPLPDGRYTLFLEAARERGTYQLIRRPLAIGAEPFAAALPGNEEIASASIAYRRRRAR